MARQTRRPPSLEREVIGAVVILYLAICSSMLAIHYLQPAGRQTRTSSTSPSHDYLRADDVAGGKAKAAGRPVDRR
jgi:hypothetical protein